MIKSLNLYKGYCLLGTKRFCKPRPYWALVVQKNFAVLIDLSFEWYVL